jgi:hypothetical protein
VFVAASSGTDGVGEPYGIQDPAADPSVFSVGAVDSWDVITDYTSRSSLLDMLAPGDQVQTTGRGRRVLESVSGTSFAAPAISGTIALLKQANPALRVGDERSILRASGVDNVDGDIEVGDVTGLTFPRLNVLHSIKLAEARLTGPLAGRGELPAAATANDLRYDRDGVLHLVYYDSAQHTLKYVTRLTDHELSAPQVIDTTTTNDIGSQLSLALDQFGRPAAAYYDAHRQDLRYASFDGSKWNVRVIDSRDSVGLYPSLAFDQDQHPVISYFQQSRGDLRVARYDGSRWAIDTVDSGGTVGQWSSLASSPDGELAVAYNSSLGTLRVARNGGSGWRISTADPTTHGVAYVSLAFDSDYEPAVSYYDTTLADLKFAAFDGAAWRRQTLASRADQGAYSKLFFDDAGTANILYYNRRANTMMKISGGLSHWTVAALESGGGKYIGAAERPDGSVTYTWFRTGDSKLLVEDM